MVSDQNSDDTKSQFAELARERAQLETNRSVLEGQRVKLATLNDADIADFERRSKQTLGQLLEASPKMQVLKSASSSVSVYGDHRDQQEEAESYVVCFTRVFFV